MHSRPRANVLVLTLTLLGVSACRSQPPESSTLSRPPVARPDGSDEEVSSVETRLSGRPFSRVRVACVRFAPPRTYFEGTERRTSARGIYIDTEFTSSKDIDFLGLDVTPALFVGDVAIRDFEAIGGATVRWIVWEPDALRTGHAIRYGSLGRGAPPIPAGVDFQGCR
jgi:hypothetical protein